MAIVLLHRIQTAIEPLVVDACFCLDFWPAFVVRAQFPPRVFVLDENCPTFFYIPAFWHGRRIEAKNCIKTLLTLDYRQKR